MFSVLEESEMAVLDDGFGPLPYLVDPEFKFLISGRWEKGGLLEIYHEESPVELIWLPLAKWAVLAVLALRAKSAEVASWRRAFMTVDELARELKQRTELQVSDPNRVIRNVFETRRRLNDAAARKLQTVWEPGPRKWGKRVIEYSPLGYRLSLPPENLDVEILGKASACLPA